MGLAITWPPKYCTSMVQQEQLIGFPFASEQAGGFGESLVMKALRGRSSLGCTSVRAGAAAGARTAWPAGPSAPVASAAGAVMTSAVSSRAAVNLRDIDAPGQTIEPSV